MKNKRSQMPREKKAGDHETTAFPHPEPMELAKLAAILRPDFQHPSDALKIAMEWYFEAVLFCSELPSGFDELFEKFASHERQDACIYARLQAKHDAAWNETLVLDASRADDDVRSYLRRHDIHIKRPRSVLHKIDGLPAYISERRANMMRKVGIEIPADQKQIVTADEIRAWCKKLENGSIAIPKILLNTIIEMDNARVRERKRVSWHKSRAKPQKNRSKRI